MRPFVRIARGELRYHVRESLREKDAGERRGGEWDDGRMSAVVEMSARRARMRTRVRSCIDTSLRRWFVIL